MASAPSAAESPTAPTPSAVHVERGSLVRDQVVALARDLVVEGECTAGAAVLGGSARVSGRIAGDLVVLGGDVVLGGGARVEGDVFVLGGRIEGAGGSIGGRAVAYPTAPSAWLMLMEGPTLGLSPFSPLVLGGKLALTVAWLLVTLLLLGSAPGAVAGTSRAVTAEPLQSFFTGLVAVLAMALTLVLFTAFLGPVLGVPLVVLVAVGALVLKLWGSVAVFLAFGRWLLRLVGRPRELPLTAALVGLLLLSTVKLLPFLGVWVWSVVTLVGVGASLSTKFGRGEPWWLPARHPVGS